jgi:hypothetical protein
MPLRFKLSSLERIEAAVQRFGHSHLLVCLHMQQPSSWFKGDHSTLSTPGGENRKDDVIKQGGLPFLACSNSTKPKHHQPRRPTD